MICKMSFRFNKIREKAFRISTKSIALSAGMWKCWSKFVCRSLILLSSFRLSSFISVHPFVCLPLLRMKRASQQYRPSFRMTSKSYSICQSFLPSDCLSVAGFVFQHLLSRTTKPLSLLSNFHLLFTAPVAVIVSRSKFSVPLFDMRYL
jgi:hypothetical protein